jgi:signal transduction histidine kinase
MSHATSEAASPAVWTLSLKNIERATRRLSSLADELLDVTGATIRLVSVEEVDLSMVVRDVIDDMQDEISRSGSEVSVRKSGSTVGHWERRRIEQVVTNLLSNALKFGLKRPIEITIDRTDENHVRLGDVPSAVETGVAAVG